MSSIADWCCVYDERYVIMDSLVKYIIQIAAAAILCTVVKTILPDTNTSGKLLCVIAGVFLIITVLSPVLKLKLDEYGEIFSDFTVSAKEITESGQIMANEAMADIIKSNTEAYIFSEAKKLNLDVDVEVMTDLSNPPVPCSITIRGNVSPYGKNRLCDIIQQQLGVPEENMKWIPVR